MTTDHVSSVSSLLSELNNSSLLSSLLRRLELISKLLRRQQEEQIVDLIAYLKTLK